jgi:hypothetical protein
MPHTHWFTSPTYGQALCQVGARVTVRLRGGKEIDGMLTDVGETLDGNGKRDGGDALILNRGGGSVVIDLADVAALGGSREG